MEQVQIWWFLSVCFDGLEWLLFGIAGVGGVWLGLDNFAFGHRLGLFRLFNFRRWWRRLLDLGRRLDFLDLLTVVPGAARPQE